MNVFLGYQVRMSPLPTMTGSTRLTPTVNLAFKNPGRE